MTRETKITMKHCYTTHAHLPVPVPTCSLYAHFLYSGGSRGGGGGGGQLGSAPPPPPPLPPVPKPVAYGSDGSDLKDG